MSDTDGHNDGSEYSLLREEIRKKPGLGLLSLVTAAPFAVLIGLLAIFVPREFDTLQTGIDEAKEAAEQGRIASEASKAASIAAQSSAEATLEQFRELKTAIAKVNARSVLCPSLDTKEMKWMTPHQSAEGCQEILPPNIFEKLCGTGLAPAFLYAQFDGQDWVFVEQVQFNQLGSDLQREIETSFERFNVNFTFID